MDAFRIFSIALGLVLLLKLLLDNFERKVALIAALLIIAATNYLHVIVWPGPSMHAILFVLYMAVIFVVINAWKRNYLRLLWTIPFIVAIVFLSPGEAPFYEYLSGGGFAFYPKNIFLILFSAQNGWVIYSPLVIFAFAGFWFLAEKSKEIFLSALLCTLGSLFFAASDPVIYFPDQFGYPGMAAIYGVLALPLAALIERALSKGGIFKILLFIIAGMLILLNVFQTWKFSKPLKISNNSTTLLRLDFENPISESDNSRTMQHAHTGKYGFCLGDPVNFSPGLRMPIAKPDSNSQQWISVAGFFYFNCTSKSNKVMLVISGNHEGRAFKYRITDLSDTRFYPGRWNQVKMNYRLPDPLSPEDLLQVYFWNYGSEKCFLDDVVIRMHKFTPAP